MLTRFGRLFIVVMFSLVISFTFAISTICADDNTTSATGYEGGDDSNAEEITPDLDIEPEFVEVGKNTLFGEKAGRDIDSLKAFNNTFIGFKSGVKTTKGDRNTFLGSLAGRDNIIGSGNVFLGFQAGINETGSNKLYIGNSKNNTLIYGDFLTGNVGIGTTNPITKFHVDATGTAFDNPNGLAIFQDDTNRQIVIGGLGIFRRDFDGPADLRINYLGYNGGTTQPRNLDIYDGKRNLVMHVDGTHKKVSIGTASPIDGKLCIASSATDEAYISLNPGGSATNDIMGVRVTESGNNTTKLHFGREFTFESAFLDLVTIDSGGKVGIGTTSPNRLLSANGTFFGGSDYIGVEISRLGVASIIKSSVAPGASANLANLVLDTYNKISGISFHIGGNEKMRIATNGNVGIGVAIPNFKLDVRGSIGNNTTLYHSDIRWKKKVSTLKSALDSVADLRGVNFEWRADEFPEMVFSKGTKVGFIAQEVEEILPELVSTGADGFKSVQYANIVPILVEAVKELKIESDNAKVLNEEFKSKIADLKVDNENVKRDNNKLRETLTALADRQKAIETMFLAVSTQPKEKLAKLEQLNSYEVQKTIQ